eukprot:6330414-Amphidinium_carterae.1
MLLELAIPVGTLVVIYVAQHRHIETLVLSIELQHPGKLPVMPIFLNIFGATYVNRTATSV